MNLPRLCLALIAIGSVLTIAFVSQKVAPATDKMVDAANAFLDSLTPQQRKKATFSFNDEERINWHFIPMQTPDRKPTRKGLALEEMTPKQKKATRALLRTGTSPHGYEQAITIMSLEAILRDLERDDKASQELAARAALLRALLLERQGRWDDAFELLRWTCRLYPYTLSAVHAPLVALRHDVAEGDSRKAEKTLDLARRYYLYVIEKDSAFLRFRHLVKDFLIESYLLMGREEEVAELLLQEGRGWRGDNGAVALFKSGLIYMNLLGDTEKSTAALKKSVELFPQTRYGKITHSQLDRIATPQNGGR